VLTNCEDLAVN